MEVVADERGRQLNVRAAAGLIRTNPAGTLLADAELCNSGSATDDTVVPLLARTAWC